MAYFIDSFASVQRRQKRDDWNVVIERFFTLDRYLLYFVCKYYAMNIYVMLEMQMIIYISKHLFELTSKMEWDL